MEIRIDRLGSAELFLGNKSVNDNGDIGRDPALDPEPEFVEIRGAEKRGLVHPNLGAMTVDMGFNGTVRIKMPPND